MYELMNKVKSDFGMKNKGQSLIETVVAIGIIVTAIVAILAMGLSHTILGGESSNRVVATNLAREGIGIVMAVKSSNQLDPTQDWPYGIDNGIYVLNYNDTTLADKIANDPDIASCSNCWLCLSGDSFLRTHCSDEEVFKRLVTVSEINSHEKKILSEVYWREKSRDYTVSLELHLTDWR